MIEPRMIVQISEATHEAAFRVGAPEDAPSDAGQNHRSCTHGAGLQGDDDPTPIQPPRAKLARGVSNRDQLGVPGGVAGGLPLIVTARDDNAIADHDTTYWDIPCVTRSLCFAQRQAHPRFGIGRRGHHPFVHFVQSKIERSTLRGHPS